MKNKERHVSRTNLGFEPMNSGNSANGGPCELTEVHVHVYLWSTMHLFTALGAAPMVDHVSSLRYMYMYTYGVPCIYLLLWEQRQWWTM